MFPLFVPSGTIYLLESIPINNTYEHTYYFSSSETQLKYFMSKPKITINGTSYQRTTKGYVVVGESIDNLINCTYMVFRNYEITSKWYYAFVTNMEYVNNKTTRVYYEIDVIQTWMFDYKPGMCFIERQHTTTDYIGDNLVSEGFDIGEYETYSNHTNNAFESYSIVIMYNKGLFDFEESELKFSPGYYAGVYNGANYVKVPMLEKNIEILKSLINTLNVASNNGIISMFMMPTYFIPDDNGFIDSPKTISISAPKPGINEAGSVSTFTHPNGYEYLPQNNKLLTFPYVCLNVSANGNPGINLAFEHFNNPDAPNKASFVSICSFGPNATGCVCAEHYLGEPINYQSKVGFGPYPLAGWGASAFSNWCTNNLLTDLLGVSNTAISSNNTIQNAVPYVPVNRTLTADELSRASYMSTRFENTVGGAQMQVAYEGVKSMASFITSTGTSKGAQTVNGIYGFPEARQPVVKVKRIRGDVAERIDKFFSHFGYAINNFAVPNFRARDKWTYIKTSGFNCVYERGSNKYEGVPSSAANEICKIHDKGITYWDVTNGAYVGVYAGVNKPIEGGD